MYQGIKEVFAMNLPCLVSGPLVWDNMSAPQNGDWRRRAILQNVRNCRVSAHRASMGGHRLCTHVLCPAPPPTHTHTRSLRSPCGWSPRASH